MKLAQEQRGLSLWSFSFTLLLIGFTAYTVLKLFPVYMEDFAVQSSLDSLEQDAAAEYRGALSVKEALMKRFQINNIRGLARDAVRITREADLYYVDVTYEKKLPYIGNISLLVNFSHTASVKASI